MFNEMHSAGRSLTDAGVKSATRVLDLLEHLARWDEACTHAEIADALDIPKSSLTQLLRTLAGRGYLSYNAESKRYALGPAVSTLAKRVGTSRDLLDVALPALERITAITQETSALNVLRGDKSEVIASQTSPQRLFYQMTVGDTAPLYATSGGKAILANLPTELLEDYLAGVHLQPLTQNTITDVDVLRQDLAQARASGVATVNEEFTPGIAGMAMPILGDSGFALASINIAVPVARLNKTLRELCMHTLSDAVLGLQKQMRKR